MTSYRLCTGVVAWDGQVHSQKGLSENSQIVPGPLRDFYVWCVFFPDELSKNTNRYYSYSKMNKNRILET